MIIMPSGSPSQKHRCTSIVKEVKHDTSVKDRLKAKLEERKRQEYCLYMNKTYGKEEDAKNGGQGVSP